MRVHSILNSLRISVAKLIMIIMKLRRVFVIGVD